MAEPDIEGAAGERVIGNAVASGANDEFRTPPACPARAGRCDHRSRDVDAAIGDLGFGVSHCEKFQQRAIAAAEVVQAEGPPEIADLQELDEPQILRDRVRPVDPARGRAVTFDRSRIIFANPGAQLAHSLASGYFLRAPALGRSDRTVGTEMVR